MKRIYLFCNAGMSTSLVASRMQDVADKHNLPLEIKAFPDPKLDTIYEQYHPDVILLGPQVKFNSMRFMQNTIRWEFLSMSSILKITEMQMANVS